MSFEIDIIRSVAHFETLAADWEALRHRCGNATVFMHHSWLLARAKQAGPGLAVINLRESGELRAALPMQLRSFTLKSVQFNGLCHLGGDVSDYCACLLDPACSSELLHAGFREALGGHLDWQWLQLDNLNSEDPISARFADAMLEHWPGAKLPGVVCPHIDFADAGAFSSNARYARRRLNRAAREGRTLSIELGCPVDSSQLQALLAGIDQHFSHGEQQRNSLLERFQPLCEDAVTAALVECSSVHIDGALAALHLGFLEGDRLYYYAPAYSERFSRDSPGHCLLHAMVEHYRARNVRRFDLMRGQEPYKEKWATGSSQNYGLHLLNTSSLAPPKRWLLQLWLRRQGAGNNAVHTIASSTAV